MLGLNHLGKGLESQVPKNELQGLSLDESQFFNDFHLQMAMEVTNKPMITDNINEDKISTQIGQ